jgi:hypothetical protein
MKRQITKETWNFDYCGRDDNHEDIKRFNLSFENPDTAEEIVEQMNTFLQAAGYRNIVVKMTDKT